MPYKDTRFLDYRVWFSDFGLEQVILEDHLTGVDPQQIQAATIDVLAGETKRIEPLQTIFMPLQKMSFSENIDIFPDLRSRMRRLGLRATAFSPEDGGFPIYNPSGQTYQINEGDRFAQTYIGGLPDNPLGDGIISDIPHGRVLTTNDEVRRMIKEGFLSVRNASNKGVLIEDGYLLLTPSGVMHMAKVDPRSVMNPTNNKDSSFYKAQTISNDNGKLRVPRQSPISIPSREVLQLSPHVAVQLFFIDSNGNFQLDGVVDPGYTGDVAAQPQLHDALSLNKDDPYICGRVIYFEGGVKHPYGSKERDNHHQGTLWGSSNELILS
ncbi:hypothetical protein COU60_00410 [Candidatus Pacearchaeota archaeon CG10_big_fil_rev_8_21_14_0_10_34_76]|nr:MAG: hypothetical protein COU60_00410 [Candidatus Pacearchaeota archaeon CG10_big_fil_rev_8_21_14_0_10_34_76]